MSDDANAGRWWTPTGFVAGPHPVEALWDAPSREPESYDMKVLGYIQFHRTYDWDNENGSDSELEIDIWKGEKGLFVVIYCRSSILDAFYVAPEHMPAFALTEYPRLLAYRAQIVAATAKSR